MEDEERGETREADEGSEVTPREQYLLDPSQGEWTLQPGDRLFMWWHLYYTYEDHGRVHTCLSVISSYPMSEQEVTERLIFWSRNQRERHPDYNYPLDELCRAILREDGGPLDALELVEIYWTPTPEDEPEDKQIGRFVSYDIPARLWGGRLLQG